MARVEPDLAFLFNKAGESLTERMTAALADLDLTVRGYCVLDKASRGDRTQGQIAEEALLDKTTMVVTLDALEKAGLARRIASPHDRRARLVSTTDAGEQLLDRAAASIREVYDDVLAAVSEDHRAALLEGLATLVGPGGPLHGDRTATRPRRSSRAG